jgi:hypothetical protein
MIREAHLGTILQATRYLTTLHWDWYYREDLEDHAVTPVIDLDKISAALINVRLTLENLTILAATDVAAALPEYPTVETSGSLKALAGFDRLKALKIPLPFLLGFSPTDTPRQNLKELIPKNIEILTITDDLCPEEECSGFDDMLLQAIRQWLADWKTSNPCLRHIHIVLRECRLDWQPSMGLIGELCSQVGVKSQITMQ